MKRRHAAGSFYDCCWQEVCMNVLNDIILFVCFNQLKSRRTYGKLGYMVMRQIAIKANIFLAAFLVLIICACADDPDALKSIGTDRLPPPVVFNRQLYPSLNLLELVDTENQGYNIFRR